MCQRTAKKHKSRKHFACGIQWTPFIFLWNVQRVLVQLITMTYSTRRSSRLISLPSALLLIVLTGVWLSPKLAWAFPEGAPPASCETMTPGHGVAPQTALFPYNLTISRNNVAPGETVEVRLASKTVSGPFMGFIAVGRTSVQETTPQGRFIREISSGEPKAKLTTCLGVNNASATHISNTLKDGVILEWEAPQVGGQYAIVVTVVKDKETFWVAKPSEFITVASGESPEPGDEIKAIYEGCGERKGCYGTPVGCLEYQNCQMFLTYSALAGNTGFQFELVGNVAPFNSPTSYVALALSEDYGMGEDSVFACRLENNAVVVSEYFNRASKSGNFGIDRQDQDIISRESGSSVDGYISCKFTVVPAYSVNVTGEQVVKSFDLAEKSYYLLVARSNYGNSTVLSRHPTASDRDISAQSVKLTDLGGGGSNPSPPPPPPISEGLAGVYEGCGASKGCFGFGTSGCVASLNCEIIVTYRSQEDQKVIQIAGRQIGVTDTTPYVAVGLSSDGKMGEDHVFGCRLESGRVVVNEYYNRPDVKANLGITRERPIISNPIGSTVEGFILCSFSVSNTYSVDFDGRTLNYDLESDAYFLLLARGSNSAIDALGQHPTPDDRSASSISVKLSDTGLLGARSTIYIQLHGAFMILAWLLCASSGMFTARYYKQTHTRIQPMGLAIWFWVHRVCMTLTLLFTIAGFILIFVEVGGLTSRSGGNAEKSHPILGIILTVLAVLQVCLALVRPAAGHTKRPLFNWVHWGTGNAAHIFGIACIYLANDLQKANLEQTRYWGVITGFICYHITLHIALTVHTFQVDKKMQIQEKKRAFTVGPMPPAGVSGEAPGTDIRTVILAAYILGATVTAICLIYFVVDALHT